MIPFLSELDELDTEGKRREHLEQCPGCESCDYLLEHYMACDHCGSWGIKDASGWIRTADGEFVCEGCDHKIKSTP